MINISLRTHNHDSGGQRSGLVTHPFQLLHWAHQEHGAAPQNQCVNSHHQNTVCMKKIHGFTYKQLCKSFKVAIKLPIVLVSVCFFFFFWEIMIFFCTVKVNKKVAHLKIEKNKRLLWLISLLIIAVILLKVPSNFVLKKNKRRALKVCLHWMRQVEGYPMTFCFVNGVLRNNT